MEVKLWQEPGRSMHSEAIELTESKNLPRFNAPACCSPHYYC
jgi:hypothetical protein